MTGGGGLWFHLGFLPMPALVQQAKKPIIGVLPNIPDMFTPITQLGIREINPGGFVEPVDSL